MFKPLLTVAILATSINVFASTIEEAQTLFSKRGEDAANANKAAAIYSQLAADEADTTVKARLLIKASESKYYFGTQQEEKEKILAEHKLGYEAAETAETLLESSFGTPTSAAVKEDLARAYYFFCANKGKYGLQKSKLWRLKKWGQMKKRLEAIQSLAIEIEDYGANRIFGKARQVLGSAKEGLAYLETAYEKTLKKFEGEDGENEVAVNSTTTLYLLDALKGNKETERFCEVYNAFSDFTLASDEVIAAHNPRLLPETLNDIEAFDNDEDLQDYATKCE